MSEAWPDFFPVDCPPGDAKPAEGTFLRLVRNAPPDETDFVAWRTENPNNKVSDECKACGVSIMADMGDVHRLQRRVASQRSKFVASGTLRPELGRLKHTPSSSSKSHHSWWVPTGVDPSPHFEVVTEDES